MSSAASTTFFRQVFHAIPEAVAILDGENRVLTVNERFLQFFGYTREECAGRVIDDLVVPDVYREEGERYARMVLVGGATLDTTATRCRRDGTLVDVAITAQPLHESGQPTAIVAMYRDISDRTILLDSIDTHIWYLTSPGVYGAVNEAHARFLGRPKVELQNRPMEEVFGAEKARELIASNGVIFSDGKPLTIDRWSIRADGEERLLRIRKKPRYDATGAVAYVVCTAEDITGEREQENTLRMLSSMVEASADPMIRLDRDYRITYMNSAAEEHYGWTLEEVAGRDPGIFNAEEGADEIQTEIRNTIYNGKVFEGRLRNRKKDGTVYVAQLRIAPITDREDEIIGFVDVQRDITADQQELEHKELLLREVQHRVKNNLATVVSLLTLQASGVAEESTAAALTDARRRIEAMLTVYESLHVSSATGTIDVAAYLESLVGRLRETFSSTVPIVCRSVDHPVVADSNAAISIGMIVNELLTNAVKHAFPGDREGTITVELQREMYPPTSGTWYRLSVADDGIAIPKDIGESTGVSLGLTLVHSLVDKIGGTLSVERDGGTRFTILFPLSVE
jgi:PAS domain S-box-containing protein